MLDLISEALSRFRLSGSRTTVDRLWPGRFSHQGFWARCRPPTHKRRQDGARYAAITFHIAHACPRFTRFLHRCMFRMFILTRRRNDRAGAPRPPRLECPHVQDRPPARERVVLVLVAASVLVFVVQFAIHILANVLVHSVGLNHVFVVGGAVSILVNARLTLWPRLSLSS